MKVESESEVAQWYSTLSDPMDCSLPGSSVHGIFQARVLEWVAIAFSVQEISQVLFIKPRYNKVLYLILMTLNDPMDCSLPGSFAHGIFQARVLEWVATAFSNMKDCCTTGY